MLQGYEIKRLFDADVVARFVSDLRVSFEDVYLFGKRRLMVYYRSEKIETGDPSVPEGAAIMYYRLKENQLPNTGESRWPIPLGEVEGIEAWREFIESADTFIGLVQETHIENARSVIHADLYSWKGKTTLRDFLMEAGEIAGQMSELEKKRIAAVLGDIPKVAKATQHAVMALARLITEDNLHAYTKMCCGTLPQSKITDELAQTKILTEKILKYTPEIASFSDKIDEAKETIAKMSPMAQKEFTDYVAKFAHFRRHKGETRAESYFHGITNPISIYL